MYFTAFVLTSRASGDRMKEKTLYRSGYRVSRRRRSSVRKEYTMSYWNTPTHPNARTPRQNVERVAQFAAAVLFTAATIAALFALVIITI